MKYLPNNLSHFILDLTYNNLWDNPENIKGLGGIMK